MIRLLLIILFIFSCKTEPIRQEIEVGKTIKVFPSNFSNSDNDFIFLWSSPSSPINSSPYFQIENDKMLFSPDIIGNYEISLTIESKNSNAIYEETFLFSAIPSENSIIKNINKSSTKNDKKNLEDSFKYTIQVASWSSLNEARADQIELRKKGYDAYTEQYYRKKENMLWWRVRVGNFSDKNIAIDVKNKLSKFRGNDLWIDYIK